MARRHARSSPSRTIGNRAQRALITATAAMPSPCPRRALPRTRKPIACRAHSRSVRPSRNGPGARRRTLVAKENDRPQRHRRHLDPIPHRPMAPRGSPEPATTKTIRPRSALVYPSRSRTRQSDATRRAIGRRRHHGHLAAPVAQAAGDRVNHEDRATRREPPGSLPVVAMRVEGSRAVPPIGWLLDPSIRRRC